jgi:hypothetical protein
VQSDHVRVIVHRAASDAPGKVDAQPTVRNWTTVSGHLTRRPRRQRAGLGGTSRVPGPVWGTDVLAPPLAVDPSEVDRSTAAAVRRLVVAPILGGTASLLLDAIATPHLLERFWMLGSSRADREGFLAARWLPVDLCRSAWLPAWLPEKVYLRCPARKLPAYQDF